mmetsp:Transcript_3363/g.5117  ORF Transcript_3363/g.5117 Transcript_3363/m.5117 type:complete len:80 (+) Transcript_3363:276-515(+)|eukprot:CAMPEP_0201533796 /NCGR_PEP_ID=MMETSP0161_2-20130828/54306_1 /ASSEMBLY_ACC=CAM_ASM_000251 /TAXON_ID=180227 /ORGANISM="Neoparamoeba aestuarina, Strain SoJaBio B1-5/56/2" /LENGTH=79 /DNA_ID=CAMNT_0047938047 /DNA_START=271 /DNA_END=510 /DNA_ORIENTATION=+
MEWLDIIAKLDSKNEEPQNLPDLVSRLFDGLDINDQREIFRGVMVRAYGPKWVKVRGYLVQEFEELLKEKKRQMKKSLS